MATFRTLDDIDVRGRRVLLRADLNVPVKDGAVTDGTRIERLAPTKRDAAWADMEERLRAFESGAEWIGPNELLLTAARR